MKINIRVTPNSSKNRIVDGDPIRVYVTTVPEDGRANRAVAELLAKHYGVPKSRIKIIRGDTGRDKLIEIEEL